MAEAANFPGLLISNSIMGFFFIVIIITLLFTMMTYPLFWLMIYENIGFIMIVAVSMAINEFIDGYFTDFGYE